MSVVRHPGVLGEKALPCGRVYKESRLKEVFIDGLYQSVRYATRTYYEAHSDEVLQIIALYAVCLVKLQEQSKTTSTSCRHSRYKQCKLKTSTL